MGMCSDPPPPPDMSGQVAEMSEYTDLMRNISADQLAWSREQYASNREILNQVLSVQLPMMEDSATSAREDRQRWEETFRPIEDNLIEEFKTYDTKERRDQMAGEAVADVTTAVEAQRENALQRLEGYGIDPSQTRSQALDASARIEEAALQAGAANVARRNVESTGRALRGEAINIGRGYKADVARAYGTALGAGTSAVGGASQTTATGASAIGSAIGNYGQVGAGITGGANIISNAYGNELSAFNARPNIGATVLGAAAGGGASALTNWALPNADGGEVVGPGGGTDETVPAAISVPGAQSTPVTMSNGEYIIPTDVVRWKGLEHIEKMVSSSQEAMSTRQATSQDGVTGVVRPNQAIPVGV